MYQKRTLYFAHAIQKLFSAKARKFFILSGNFLLRGSPFHIVKFFEVV